MIRERLARLRVKLDRCDPDVLGSWPCIQDCVVDAAVAFAVPRRSISAYGPIGAAAASIALSGSGDQASESPPGHASIRHSPG